jgi:hypothetical protein
LFRNARKTAIQAWLGNIDAHRLPAAAAEALRMQPMFLWQNCDAARSLLQQSSVERLQKLYHPVVTSLLWLASMRVVNRALERYASRVLLSRYEDLVADPIRGAR